MLTCCGSRCSARHPVRSRSAGRRTSARRRSFTPIASSRMRSARRSSPTTPSDLIGGASHSARSMLRNCHSSAHAKLGTRLEHIRAPMIASAQHAYASPEPDAAERTESFWTDQEQASLFARNVLSQYVVLGVNMGLGLVMLPFNVAHLGQSAYGLWVLVTSLTTYFDVLEMGYGSAQVKFTAQYRA